MKNIYDSSWKNWRYLIISIILKTKQRKNKKHNKFCFNISTQFYNTTISTNNWESLRDLVL